MSMMGMEDSCDLSDESGLIFSGSKKFSASNSDGNAAFAHLKDAIFGGTLVLTVRCLIKVIIELWLC